MKTRSEIETRWASETNVTLRYGGAHEIKGLTATSAALRDFTKNARATAHSNVKLHLKSLDDPTLGVAERMLLTAEHAKRGLTGLDGTYNRLFNDAEALAKDLIGQLEDAAAPSANAGRAMQDAMMLSLLREVADPAKQLQMVKSDPAMRRAVATAPRALSGFAEEVWNGLRRDYWAEHAPETLARYDDLVSALSAAEMAHKAAHRDTGDAVDFEAAAELAARKVAA